MKKISYFSLAILFFALSVFTACKKDDSNTPSTGNNSNNPHDSVPPVINITGSNPLIVTLNSPFVDPGATVTDNSNSSISVINNISPSNPNVNLAGTYIITYSAADSSGNSATATRTVIVQNSAANLAGNYMVADTCGIIPFAYSQTITASTTVNGRIHFNKFADYSGNSGIFADVTGNNISLPSQVANSIGSFSEDHQFSGSGAVVSPSPGAVIHLNYTDNNLSVSVTANCTAWFYQQ